MNPRTLATRIVMAAMLAAATLGVSAQGFPNKPIKLIVGFPPGGGSDAAARIAGAALAEKLGQPVVVENKAGANTILATQFVGSQPADGYTLLFVSASFAINPSLYKLTYDPEKDFTPVGLVALVPLMLITGPEVPINSVKDLVAMAKAKPGEVTYASFGTGSAGHLAGELFCSMTGTNMQHIPFKGSAPAIADVMGGRVTVMFPGIGSAVPLVNGGKLKALAVTTAQRASSSPNVPTVEESGVPGYVVSTWESIIAPAGTPADVVAKLNKALAEVMATKEVREKMVALGLEPDGTKNPAQTAQFIRAEMAKWAKVVKERGVKVE